ncbi:hypothetical protein HK097_004968 [Rhizophlyctis rosea]|uniref:Uncharacterized protein n=1 Tax=Rhizophlyctis rosea TaxID=64517 RepID=A0AAD5WYQ0_9FUNG|nr:hypothetical protein HK097_004968 [Rhizophlyctis rosea]
MRLRYLTSRDDLKMCWDIVHEIAVVVTKLKDVERAGSGTTRSGSKASAEEARRKLGVVVRGFLDDVKRPESWFAKACERDALWVFEDVFKPRIDRQSKAIASNKAPATCAPASSKSSKGSSKGGHGHAHATPPVVTPPPCCYDLFLAICAGIQVDDLPKSGEDVKRVLRQVLDGWTVWTGQKSAVGILILVEMFCQGLNVRKAEGESGGSYSQETLEEIVGMLFGKIVEAGAMSFGGPPDPEGSSGWDMISVRLPWALVKPILRRAVDILDQASLGNHAQNHGWMGSSGLKGVEQVVDCVVRCVRDFQRNGLKTEDVEDFQNVVRGCAELLVGQLEAIASFGQASDAGRAASNDQMKFQIAYMRSSLPIKLQLLCAFLPQFLSLPLANTLVQTLVKLLQSPLTYGHDEVGEMVLDVFCWVVEECEGAIEDVTFSSDVPLAWKRRLDSILGGEAINGEDLYHGLFVEPKSEAAGTAEAEGAAVATDSLVPIHASTLWDPWKWLNAWPSTTTGEGVQTDGPLDLRFVQAKRANSVERLQDIVLRAGNDGTRVVGSPIAFLTGGVAALTPAATVIDGSDMDIVEEGQGKRSIYQIGGQIAEEAAKRVKLD